MSSAAENLANLMQCLAFANISDTEPANGNGKKFLAFLKKANINDMDDFVGYVEASKYSEEWAEFCTFKATADGPPERDRLLWARVKLAWEGMVETKNAKKGQPLLQ